MTLRELVKLDKEGGIPDFLKKKWEERHGWDPIEAAQTHLRNKQAEKIVFCAFMVLLVFLAAGVCFSIKFEVLPSILLSVASAAGVGAILFCWRTNFFVPHESSTRVGEFARNFGKLRKWVGSPTGEGAHLPKDMSQGIFVLWADQLLIGRSLDFLSLEKLAQETPATYENWGERCSAWNDAEGAREKFKEIHQTLFELGLADRDWGRYFQEATTRLQQKS